MFQQIRSHSLSLQLVLPILAFLPYLIYFFNFDFPLQFRHNAQGWIYQTWLNGYEHRPWLFMILGWTFNMLIAFALYWLNIRFEVIGKRTVYISYLYGILVFTPLAFHSFNTGMLGGVFILISLVFMFLLYHRAQTKAFLFNVGLFWGLAVICYPPYIAMLPLFVISARLVRTTRLKDFLMLFAGLLTPIWVWLALAYLNGTLEYQWLSAGQWLELRKTWPPELPGNNVLWYVFIGFIAIILIANMNLYRVKKDVGRRVLIILVHLIWICPLTLLIFERVSVEILWVALMPIAFMTSVAAFNTRSPWKSDLIFIGYFLIMLAFQLNLII